MVTQIEEIKAAMSEAESIGEVNEEQVFKAYKDAIKQNHTAPFEDFT